MDALIRSLFSNNHKFFSMFVKSAMLCCSFISTSFAASLEFQPGAIQLAPGESVMVEVVASNVPASGLAAFQFDVSYDPAVIDITDPNIAPSGSVPADPPPPAYAPLGNHLLCDVIRGAACTDSNWMLTQSARSPIANILKSSGKISILYGTSGGAAPVSGSGVVALLEITALADGVNTVQLSNSILADNNNPPQSHTLTLNSLSVQVVPLVLATPQNVVTRVKGSRVTIVWDAVNGATVYRVFRRSSLETDFSELILTDVTIANDVLTTGVTGIEYYVVAENDLQVSSSSSITTATPTSRVVLETPQNVVARAKGSRVTMVWDTVSGATAYRVFKRSSMDAGFSEVMVTDQTIIRDVFTAGVTSIEYYVIAQNDSGFSAVSAITSVTPTVR